MSSCLWRTSRSLPLVAVSMRMGSLSTSVFSCTRRVSISTLIPWWLLPLNLQEGSFTRPQELGLVVDVTSRLLESILDHLVSASFHFALFNADAPSMNKESVLLVKLSRTFAMSHMINRSFRGYDLFPSSSRTHPCLLLLLRSRLP